MIAVAPSILAADFARLGEEVLATERGGADRIHIDVMDGHFVPNLSMGPVVVEALRPVTRLPLEVHLMVREPASFVDSFLNAGADTLIFHWEVFPVAGQLIRSIHARQKRVGIAINPGTPVEVLEPYLVEIDLALCMTVWPGFGGQAFLSESLDRIRAIRAMIQRHNPNCDLEVDGGITMQTAATSVEAGADVLVAGTSLFRARSGPQVATQEMLRIASDGAFE